MLARVIMLAGRDIPLSAWTPIALVWQDLLVVLLVAAIDRVVRPVWLRWSVYGLVVIYTALNVALVHVLSSPMTWPMLRATRGTLADSIKYHLTLENLMLIVAVLAWGGVLPFLLGRLRLRRSVAIGSIIVAVAFVALGPTATAHVDVVGRHRNALVTLISTAFPRIQAQHQTADWRKSRFDEPASEDLSRFHAVAAGRNVVMIHLESTGAGYLHPYGSPVDPMPKLTRLATKAVLFENAYAVYPESIKGLFSVLCSRYPAFDSRAESYERVSTPSIAQVLAKAGYRTALFHSGRFMYLGMESVIGKRGYQTLEDAGDIGGNHNSSFGVDEPATVKRMLGWVDALPRDKRFFTTYLPIAGHHPYETPEPGPFPENEDIGRYRNALHYADAVVAELIEGLRIRGLDENTLFVIFGDHGEAFGQHQGNYGHTLFIYEENIRVPLLLVAPGLFEGPIRVHRTASLIDLAPTICDLLGLPPPADYQGRSLFQPGRRMALFFADYSLGFFGLRDGDWKFIHELDSGRSKLFDLCSDPGETNDLARKLPERVGEYLPRLQQWSAAQKDLILRCQR